MGVSYQYKCAPLQKSKFGRMVGSMFALHQIDCLECPSESHSPIPPRFLYFVFFDVTKSLTRARQIRVDFTHREERKVNYKVAGQLKPGVYYYPSSKYLIS
jgi:hypothetical protein